MASVEMAAHDTNDARDAHDAQATGQWSAAFNPWLKSRRRSACLARALERGLRRSIPNLYYGTVRYQTSSTLATTATGHVAFVHLTFPPPVSPPPPQ